MSRLVQLLHPFAQSIFAKAQALQDLSPTRFERSRIQESISDDIKKCSNFTEREVSERAREVADRIGVDLFSQSWHDQHKFDRGRAIFHFEHVEPVNVIRAACMEADSVNDVSAILHTRMRVAWILKSEDANLTKLGYRSRRADPSAAYLAAQIRLIRQPRVHGQ